MASVIVDMTHKIKRRWLRGILPLLFLLLAVSSEAFEDRFKAASAQKQAEKKADKKDAEKEAKALRMPYDELPSAIQTIAESGECTPEEYYAVYNTLWRLLKPAAAKKNPAAVAGVMKALESVEQVSVGPENKLFPLRQPLEAFRLICDCEQARTLPADQIRKHPSADLFPGKVADDAARLKQVLTINGNACGYISTGLYAPAGEMITVQVPDELVGRKVEIVIGLHQANLDMARHKSIRRAPHIDRRYGITSNTVRCASAFGGLIYFSIPASSPTINLKKADYYGSNDWKPELNPVEVGIEGAVQAPWFQLGETDVEQWNRDIRHYPAPFAEIGTDQIVFTLPSEYIRELDHPDEVLKVWEQVLSSAAELAGTAQPRPNAIRFLIDAHVNWGAAYASYPIVAPFGWVDAIIDGKAGWGHVHEIGHLHQQRAWTFYGCGEVTVNLFSLYTLEKVYGDTSRRQPEKMAGTLSEWFSQSKAERTWEGKGHPGKLTCYMQLVNEFGWEPIMRCIHSYRPELDTWNNRKEMDERACSSEFVVRLSRETGHNLYAFFDDWGLPLNSLAADRIADLPIWNPNADPVQQISMQLP